MTAGKNQNCSTLDHQQLMCNKAKVYAQEIIRGISSFERKHYELEFRKFFPTLHNLLTYK